MTTVDFRSRFEGDGEGFFFSMRFWASQVTSRSSWSLPISSRL